MIEQTIRRWLPALRLTPGLVIGTACWAVLAGIGMIGLYHRAFSGHELAGYGSYIPWGIWVALYFYGAGIAAGVFLTGGLGYLAGIKGLASPAGLRSTVVLSLAALMPALLAIGLDLGRFDRAIHLFLYPNFTSVLTLNTMLYSMFMIAAALAWLLTWQKSNTWLKPLIALGAVACAAFAMGSGAFFAAVSVKPYWDSALWPVVTLVSGLTGGAAILMLARSLLPEVDADHDPGCRMARHVVMSGLVLYLVLAGVKWITGHVYDSPGLPASQAPALPVLSTAWFQLGAGCLLPLVLLAIGGRRLKMIGALAAAAALLGGRMDLVLKGQPTEMPLLPEAFHHARLVFSYRVTAMEWQVSALLLAIAIAIYAVGQLVNRSVEFHFKKAKGEETL